MQKMKQFQVVFLVIALMITIVAPSLATPSKYPFIMCSATISSTTKRVGYEVQRKNKTTGSPTCFVYEVKSLWTEHIYNQDNDGYDMKQCKEVFAYNS